MPTSFRELVESLDWEKVRNSIKRQRALKTLASSILEVLLNPKANETPPDVLPSLFEKLRPLRDKKLCLGDKRDGYRHDRFAEQLFSKVCSFEILEFVYNYNPMKYAPHILRTLLEEHKRVYKHAEYATPILERIRQNVCEMWEDRLAGRGRGIAIVIPWRGEIIQRPAKSNVVPIETEDELLSIQSRDDLKKSKDLFDLWKNTEMLVLHTKSDDNTPLLHALLRDGYPIVVAWLAAKIHPDQLWQRDGKGRIPLHYVAKEPIVLSVDLKAMQFSSSFCEAVCWDSKGASFVKLVTDLFPEGGKYVDNKGKLPLAAYLEDAGNPHFEDVSLLINASSRALLTRDTGTHLLPFMVPTQQRGNDHSICRHHACNRYLHDDCGETSLIYQILRENPAAVAIGVTGKSLDSYYVRHLKKKFVSVEAKLADSKAKVNALVYEKNQAEDRIEKQNEDIVKQNEEIKRLRQLLDGKFSSEDCDTIPSKRARLEEKRTE
jgi:hypothetical protein